MGDAEVNRLIKRKDMLSAAGLSGHGAKALKALRSRGRQWATALRLISQAIADCWFVGTVAEEAIAACMLALVAKPNGGTPCNNIGLVVFENLPAVWCTLNDSNPLEPHKRIGLVATVEPSVCARD